MGTSSSYGGPSGSGALLPPWAPAIEPVVTEPVSQVTPANVPTGEPPTPSEPEPAQQIVQTQPKWSGPKNSLSRYASSGGSATTAGAVYLRSAGRGFVRAQGGARSASRAARAGVSTAQGIGSFLGALSSRGVSDTARAYRLGAFVGKSADSLLAAVVDQVAPAGAQLEQVAARAAAVETLAELFAEHGVAAEGLAALEGLTADAVRTVMERFLCRYIFERLIQTLGKTLENRPAAEVVRLESGVKRYLEGTIRLDLAGVDVGALDWMGAAGRDLITGLYDEAYGLMERG